MGLGTSPLVEGFVKPGFEQVREAFIRNFTERGEVGGAVCVYEQGHPVVDLAGGVIDQRTALPYRRDTLQPVFSTTKGLVAAVANMLADRAQLDLDAPVAEYWPEFGQKGKQGIPVRWLLTHQAGLAAIDRALTFEELLAWDPVIERLAEQEPNWTPGTAHGYHTLTYGFLVGEVVRRVTGASLGEWLSREITTPLGVEFVIGLPPDLEGRVAPVLPYPEGTSGLAKFTELGPGSLPCRAVGFVHPPLVPDLINDTRVHRAPMFRRRCRIRQAIPRCAPCCASSRTKATSVRPGRSAICLRADHCARQREALGAPPRPPDLFRRIRGTGDFRPSRQSRIHAFGCRAGSSRGADQSRPPHRSPIAMSLLSVLPDLSGTAWLPLADAIFKATLLLAGAAIAATVLRRRTAAARHLLWTLALVSAMVLPALSLTLPRWQVPLVTLESAAIPPAAPEVAVAPPIEVSAPVTPPRRASAGTNLNMPGETRSRQSMAPRLSFSATLLLIWALGATLILGRLALGFAAVGWMSRRTERVTAAPWLQLARALGAELGISPRIVFPCAAAPAMPMAWGIVPAVRPHAGRRRHLAGERLRIVLLHELAHVKRRDA